MKNTFVKIWDTCKSLKTEILSVCLIVFLLVLLNDPGTLRETVAGGDGLAADAAEQESGAGESESDTEAWTEGMTETEGETFTPAELAMLESEEETEEGGETAVSDAETLLLPPEMAQLPEDFQIPMAMPDTGLTEYREDSSVRLWSVASRRYGIVEYGESRPFLLLKKMVENRIANYDGDWSVYVKDLKTDESFVVNDRPMKSASVMKLFIMGTVYKAIEAGELERTDEVVSLLNSMISVSDNEASNRLLYLLGNSSYADGIGKVDEFIQEYGFSDMTVEYNGFNNSDTVINPGHNNQVSAKDCGKLLEDIYRRTWMNRSAANEMEQMMLNQQTRYKIPAGLPEGVACGNKTGEMDTTENDAAVVYAEDCDYILVVLSSDWNSKDQAISRIASMSGMVYEFLN